MVNFVLRQSRELVLAMNEVMRLTGAKSANEAVTLAYHLIASDFRKNKPINLVELGVMAFDDEGKDVSEFSETKRFSVEEEDWALVLQNYRAQTGLQRVRTVRLTKEVLNYARVRLTELKTSQTAHREDGERKGVELLRKIADLILEDTEEARKQLTRIQEIIGGNIP